MRAASFLILAALMSVGCGDDDTPGPGPIDGGGVADAGPTDSGLIACGEPARVCPPEPPLAGGPCEGALMCAYDIMGMPGGTDWTFQCMSGAWNEMLLCGGCAPQLAERCNPPFAGKLVGATVEIGPATGPFRPFAPGERVAPVFGAQGFTMLQFRVRVVGDGVPSCVSVHATTMLEGVPFDNSAMPVKLRCGESLPVLEIFNDNPCEFRDYAAGITVDIPGVGTATVSGLVLTGGSCPRGMG